MAEEIDAPVEDTSEDEGVDFDDVMDKLLSFKPEKKDG
jgi:hypothetical protein